MSQGVLIRNHRAHAQRCFLQAERGHRTYVEINNLGKCPFLDGSGQQFLFRADPNGGIPRINRKAGAGGYLRIRAGPGVGGGGGKSAQSRFLPIGSFPLLTLRSLVYFHIPLVERQDT